VSGPAAAPREVGLLLEGLRCSSCVNRVEEALRAAPGVAHAAVSYTTHRALVGYDPARTDEAALVERVRALGFSATPYDPEILDRPAQSEARLALSRLLVAAFCAGNVMLVAVALYLGSDSGIDDATRRALRWLAIGLSIPSVTWCAAPFWRGAWIGLRRGEIPFDVPVVLGVSVSFVVSILGTIAETTHVFADSAAMIVFLVLLGRTLERNARARALSAVEHLVKLAPDTAVRRIAGGVETVAASALRPGDFVVVAPGQAVPTDGRIVRGRSELDESLLTGESVPVLRGEGDAVVGATRNTLAEIDVEVRAPAGAGTLARIAALLERAQTTRPRIQRVADRVAQVFAPAVLVAAAGTALAWTLAGMAPLDVALTAAAVLIVACPCALGLATPAALAAAIGRAARFGVLVKSGEALERCARVATVMLDKTGTLTEGRLSVSEVLTAPGVSARSVVEAAAAAEGMATHPVAAAVRAHAAEQGCAPRELRGRTLIPGSGVTAGEGASRVVVGSRALLRAHGASLGAELDAQAARAAARGESLAFVATADSDRADAPLVTRGALVLADPLRPDAREAVRRLREVGAEVQLVSGDHASAARRAAAQAGIAAVASEVTPDGKVGAVARLRARSSRSAVLAVGDGVNDAAALAAADVGMAFARGADVAVHAADFVVQAPRLGAVPDTIELARATMRRIRENLSVALLYNALAVPLAAGGWLHPLPAAIAMSLSSVVVTANAVRLLRWAPRSAPSRSAPAADAGPTPETAAWEAR
jgi:Cu2+-exporting ATPase